VAARTNKTNRSKRVDTVRASRDGHQFHEAWVARRALGLLLPHFDLCGIAVEGLSEEDEEGAPDAAVEIADATFYYGNGTSFEFCARVEVAQFKYSISKAGTPLRIADLRKTLVKFAATEKELISKHGAEAVARKVTYSINTNRPFASEMLEAFRLASTGQPAVSADANAQLFQLRSAVKKSDDGLRRFADRVLLVGRMDSLEAVERGNARIVADWSASSDALTRARIGDLREMVRKKAGSHGQHDKIVAQVAFRATEEMDETANYQDTLDYANYGVNQSVAVLAQRAAIDVLDKIAGFASEYLGLQGDAHRVYFASRWHTPSKQKNGAWEWQPGVAAEISAGNPGVLALGDLASDVAGDGYLSSHRLLRHTGTHRFVVLHDMLPHTPPPSPFVEHHRQFDFERTTVKTLQMCRAALTYAREMVLWRERRSSVDGKLCAPMYAPPHHEIRGLKSRMRKR